MNGTTMRFLRLLNSCFLRIEVTHDKSYNYIMFEQKKKVGATINHMHAKNFSSTKRRTKLFRT